MKLLALGLMFIDHAGYFYFEQHEWIRGVGRACAPLFLFLAGFAPHYRFDRKLLFLALVLTAFDWWIKGAPNTLNILWSILFVRALLSWLESKGRYYVRLHEWGIACIALLPVIMLFQYGTLGVLFALAGYVFKHREHYKPLRLEYFLRITAVLYVVIISALSEFQQSTSFIALFSLWGMIEAVLWFSKQPLAPVPCPQMLAPALRFTVRQTAVIYVVHLIVLMALTGKSL